MRGRSDIARAYSNVLLQGFAFYALVAVGLGYLSKNWHVAVHGGLVVSVPVVLWLEARASCRPTR